MTGRWKYSRSGPIGRSGAWEWTTPRPTMTEKESCWKFSLDWAGFKRDDRLVRRPFQGGWEGGSAVFSDYGIRNSNIFQTFSFDKERGIAYFHL